MAMSRTTITNRIVGTRSPFSGMAAVWRRPRREHYASAPVDELLHERDRVFLFLVLLAGSHPGAESGRLARRLDVDEQCHLLELPAVRDESVRVIGAIRNLERHGAELSPTAEDCLLALAESFLDMRVAAGAAERLASDQSPILDFQSDAH